MREIRIGKRKIGPQHPTYIIAEMSGNHNGDFNKALRIVKAAKEAGADALKLQTYKADTITIDCFNEFFQIKGTLWEGRTLYDLYKEAYTPWEWQPRLKEVADRLKLDLFSSPFDPTAVDFLDGMGVPAYKVASFELVDIPLLKKIARTGKPVIMSTGMATLGEVGEAVNGLREAGNRELALLKCTSAYPAPFGEMNLRTIPHLAEAFDVVAGLSDHSLGIEVAVGAVAIGARIIEKHFTLSRKDPGPDSPFSMEPAEFKQMVDAIRNVEKALGTISYDVTEREKSSRVFRRSLFVVRDVGVGEKLTEQNVKSIRPGFGLHTRHLGEVIGRRARKNIPKGTPLTWDLLD